MVKAKAPTYNFSPTQCVHLEAILAEYIQYLKEDDVDGCDQVITEVIATLCSEAGIQDDTKKELVATSVRQWLNIKSSEVKRSKVVKFFELTGIQCFHTDQWESKIKPLVLTKFEGPNPNKQKMWLKEIMLARDQLWSELLDDERAAYELQAQEFNEGTAAKEMKALYGDKHFEEELQKVLNHFNKIFDARIIAVTVRVGVNGTMSSILEPKGPSRFLKTLPEGKMYKFTPADYLTKMKAELNPEAEDAASEDDTLRLRFGPNKEPIFPRGPYDRQGKELRELLAVYVRWYYNKIRVNHKKDVGPPWQSMEGHWSQYIDPKYFPSQVGLEEHVDLATFSLRKTFRMPLPLVVAWAELIVQRQDAQANGELHPDEEVFAWTKYLSDKDRWIAAGEADGEIEATKKRRRRAKAPKKNKKQRTSDDGSGEEVVPRSENPDAPVDFGGSGFQSNTSNPGPDASGLAIMRKQKGRVMNGSPASAGDGWPEQIKYLLDLCDDINYRNIVSWLNTTQTQSDLVDEVIPRGAPHFGELGWSNPLASLPEVVHASVNGANMVEAFLGLWEKNYQMLWGIKGSVEELALMGGQLIRDIRICQFAQMDQDDPWPSHLPYYLCNTSFNLITENRISNICKVTWEAICYTTRMELAQGLEWSMDLLGAQASGSQTINPGNTFAAFANPGPEFLTRESNFIHGSHPSGSIASSRSPEPSGDITSLRTNDTLGKSMPTAIRKIPLVPSDSLHAGTTALRVPKARQPPRKQKQQPSGVAHTIPATVVSQRSGDSSTSSIEVEQSIRVPDAGMPEQPDVGLSQQPDATLHKQPDAQNTPEDIAPSINALEQRQLRTKKKFTWRKDGTQVPEDADIPTAVKAKGTNVTGKKAKIRKTSSRK